MRTQLQTITPRPDLVGLEPMLAVVRDDPFDPMPPRIVRVMAGDSLAELIDHLGFDPIARPLAVAVIDGEEVPESDWANVRIREGQHVAICIAPQGGGEDGAKLLTTVLMIFVMVAAFWVSGGALAPMLGQAFAQGAAGANIAAAAVTAVGQLAISALVKPPSPPSQDKINPVYSVEGASNRWDPFAPITLSLGTRRVFPKLAARGFQEIVGDDFYYRMVVEWGPIGIAVSDLKAGDTPLADIDGVQAEHRFLSSDPHPTLYPAQVFQEQAGPTLDSTVDWESRRTIPDATEAAVIIAFPSGLGHTSKKGKSEQWAAQIEVRYRLVTGEPGSEVFGSWQSPPGNGVSSPTRGGVVPGPGKYGFSATKRSQPFFRAVTFSLPAAGLYEVQVRRSSTNEDPEVNRTFDDMAWQVIESRRPGRPVTRDDVAYSVFRFKGTDETQGRIQTINGLVQRLIPRFNPGFLSGGDLSTASPASLDAPSASSNPWEEILWLYRNGFEGREPLADNAVDWPSFAVATRNAVDENWTFDHVFDGAARIEEAVETIAFAACGRACFIGNKLTAVVDAPQVAPVAVISDRKARNVKAVKVLSRPPHGFRITFDDAADGYRTREVRVYVGAYTSETATRFDEIRIPGVVHWTAVHRLVQRNYRNSRLQNRTITLEVSVHDVDTAVRLGAWVGVRTKVVETGRASGWVREVETNGSGDVTAVILDQPVEQTVGDALVLQWSRAVAPGVSETLSNALALKPVLANVIHERVEFTVPASGADKPQAGDSYIYGVSGFVRLDGLVDNIEAVDHDWLRLHLVNYAPARFDESGFTVPAYTPAFERPAFIRAPELELVSIGQNLDQTVIHFRPVPGDRGEIAHIIASRAIAPDSVSGGEPGVWAALPRLAATERQLVTPSAQAGDAYIYRLAAVSPYGDTGPWLNIDTVEAPTLLPSPTNVAVTPTIETGAGIGAKRGVLLVSADPVEDVQIEHLVVEARRVALTLDDPPERELEIDQPDFDQMAIIDADFGRTVLRGLPPGARIDVQVYFRGTQQAVSAPVRVEDVVMPAVDVAGSAADFEPGSALEAAIEAALGSGLDEYARSQAAQALLDAAAAFAEAEAVRSEFITADAGLQTQVNAKASTAALNTVESDAETARTLLGDQITAAYTLALSDLEGVLQAEIDSKASITQLNTVDSAAAAARAALLTDARAEWQGDDAALQIQINTKASLTQLTTAESNAAAARATLLTDARTEWQSDDDALQLQINTKASTSQLTTVESDAAAARAAMTSSYTAQFGTITGNVSVLQGVLAQPSGAEAIVAFRANTSTGEASLQVISTSGSMGTTKVKIKAASFEVEGNAIVTGSLSAISANLGNITAGAINIAGKFVVTAAGVVTIQSGASGERFVQTNTGVKVYDAGGVARVELGLVT